MDTKFQNEYLIDAYSETVSTLGNIHGERE